MKTKLGFLILGLGLVFTLSCSKYPPSSDRLLEDLAIVTQYDTKVNFNDYKTYSITNSITKITDKDTATMTGPDATAVLSEIAKNMEERGFTKPTGTDKPDLGINVVYFENTKIYAYYPDYYYWGYPYYDYGYYYPYYPVYYTSYTAGTCDIDLIDLKNVAPNNSLYLRWSAFIRGLLTGTHTDAEILNSIDQAFTQTPQLQTTAK
jgi:hypothetical protein